MATVEMTLKEIESLTRDVFKGNGCDAANTEALVATVVGAERDGSGSHGLFRVPGYVASLRSGKVNGAADPSVKWVTPTSVHVEGDNGFGPLAIERGVPALAEAAAEYGIANMAITNSYHFAALWPETEALAARQLAAIAFVNYLPVMAPYGAKTPLFGTNPMSFAWPRPGKNPIVVDMASSMMAQGEIQIAARDGRKLPLGAGLDAEGRPSTDPAAVLEGCLLPFGDHKGSAIALMVELLAAAATGERFSFEAGENDNGDGGPPRRGELIIAISPRVIAGENWADHAESFFSRFDSIGGARLPGARRHARRLSTCVRHVDRELLSEIQALRRQTSSGQ